MPYRLAEKRCANFRTCGRDATGTIGISRVNYELHDLFIEGKLLLDAVKCAAVRPVVNQIVSKMTIPLIQGTLRYAFKVHTGEENTAKAKAEGAVFAASVLPLVHDCSTEAAGTIYDNMKLGATSTDFVAVKNAFESTYSCLSISCAEVGGYWDALDNKYEAFAGPCTDVTATVTVTITVDIAALDTAGQNALIAEFARTASNGIMTADVTLSDVGVLTVEPQVIPSPPPPSPPFTDCGSLSPSPPPPPAPPVSTCSESKTDNADILGMGVPLALVALASLGFSCLLVSKEKTGKPLFLSLANGHTNGH